MLVVLKKYYEDIVAHCKTSHDSDPPKPDEAWIGFAAVSAKSASTKSHVNGASEEQLLPRAIPYDP